MEKAFCHRETQFCEGCLNGICAAMLTPGIVGCKLGCFPKCLYRFLINFWHHKFIKPLKIGGYSVSLLNFLDEI